jgi:hypothetical protein
MGQGELVMSRRIFGIELCDVLVFQDGFLVLALGEVGLGSFEMLGFLRLCVGPVTAETDQREQTTYKSEGMSAAPECGRTSKVFFRYGTSK